MSSNELLTWNAAHDTARALLAAAAELGMLSFDGLSAWMRERLTHRLADVIHREGQPTPGAHYLIPFGDHEPTPGSDDDRTCDRCGHFAAWDAPNDEFYVLRIALLANVTVWGGLCAPCMALENPQEVRDVEAH
ncbi:hypothetical protein M2317_000764 [Microbacterium sp. ZKA21]|uniref:hypothetical protein n=1 Tax=Microbacterium sp. ZKA21 TaxID=3381694 RepID=UPI003D1A79EF